MMPGAPALGRFGRPGGLMRASLFWEPNEVDLPLAMLDLLPDDARRSSERLTTKAVPEVGEKPEASS